MALFKQGLLEELLMTTQSGDNDKRQQGASNQSLRVYLNGSAGTDRISKSYEIDPLAPFHEADLRVDRRKRDSSYVLY